MSENTKKVNARKRKKNKKSKISAGFITFFVVLGIMSYVVFNLYTALHSTLIQTYILDMGEISNTIPKDILIIREEYILKSPAAGYISYYLEDGDRLRKDGVVGRLENQELKGDENINLQIINRRINELRGGASVQNPEVEIGQIDSRIDFLFSDIQNRIREKDYSYVPSLKNELMSLVERKNLIQGASSLGDMTLEQLQAQKAEIENRMNSDKYYIRTQNAGILSFYYDGQNEKLQINNINNLSVTDIENFKDSNQISKQDKVNEGDIVGEIVGNHLWYFISEVTKEDIQRIERGKSLRCFIGEETVHVTLNDFYKGKDGRFVGIFKVENENFDFTTQRKHQALIEYKRSSGLMVKKDSVITYEGKKGIFTVNEVGVAEFKEIQETLGENEQYYSVSYDIDAPKKASVIGLYDEVVEKPKDIKQGQRVR